MTKITRLRKKADKLFYFLVMLENNGLCEICNKPATTAHHIIPKSQSSLLRYDKRNGVSICKSCHFSIHVKTDPQIIHKIFKIKGDTLIKELFDIKNQLNLKTKGIKYYTNIINYLQETIESIERN